MRRACLRAAPWPMSTGRTRRPWPAWSARLGARRCGCRRRTSPQRAEPRCPATLERRACVPAPPSRPARRRGRRTRRRGRAGFPCRTAPTRAVSARRGRRAARRWCRRRSRPPCPGRCTRRRRSRRRSGPRQVRARAAVPATAARIPAPTGGRPATGRCAATPSGGPWRQTVRAGRRARRGPAAPAPPSRAPESAPNADGTPRGPTRSRRSPGGSRAHAPDHRTRAPSSARVRTFGQQTARTTPSQSPRGNANSRAQRQRQVGRSRGNAK